MSSLRVIAIGMVAAALAACAPPVTRVSHSAGFAPSSVATAPVDSTARPGPPVIQIRQFPASATVAVLGWDADDPAVGLRAQLRRDGTLVGDDRYGDHRLYLSTIYANAQGGFVRAMVEPRTLLRAVRPSRDYDACWGGKQCSPMETVGVRIPDELLRASRDSLVVTFYAPRGSNWSIALRGELIHAYLRAVDSTAAALRNKPVE